VVDGLYQQRPCRIPLKIVGRKWPLLEMPLALNMIDNSGLDICFHCQAGKFIRTDGRRKVGQCRGNKEGFALPVLGQESVPVERELAVVGHGRYYSTALAWAAALPI